MLSWHYGTEWPPVIVSIWRRTDNCKVQMERNEVQTDRGNRRVSGAVCGGGGNKLNCTKANMRRGRSSRAINRGSLLRID